MKTTVVTFLTVFLAHLSPLPSLPLQKLAQEEKYGYYKKWLDEDVRYIITDEERAVFEKLTVDEERDAFIEQFWARRDTDPRTAINEYLEEHYRRVAYANERFTSGIEGWATDRGRIYITFGPSDHIEDHPGGFYIRRPEEGGGTTSTYAFQRWSYRYLPGVGSGVEIEFVDPTNTGEYRIALRPTEKDALFYAGAGQTDLELRGIETRAGRMRSALLMRNLGLEGDPLYMTGAQPLQRVSEYFYLKRPPQIEFKDLQKIVDTSLYYDTIPVQIGVNQFRVGPEEVLAPVTLRIPKEELAYREEEGRRRAVVNIYGKVTDLLGRITYEFEDVVHADHSLDLKPEELSGVATYQKSVPLKPGRYKLTLILKYENSGRISVTTTSIRVVPFESGTLTTSSIVVADKVLSSEPETSLTDPFVVPGGFKIFPNLSREFTNRDRCFLYLEVYEVAVDQSTLQSFLGAEILLVHAGRVVHHEQPKVMTLGDRVALLHNIDLSRLPSGKHRIELHVDDRISGQRVIRRTEITIIDESGGSHSLTRNRTELDKLPH